MLGSNLILVLEIVIYIVTVQNKSREEQTQNKRQSQPYKNGRMLFRKVLPFFLRL